MYIVGTLTPFIGRLKKRKKLQPLLITAPISHIPGGVHIAHSKWYTYCTSQWYTHGIYIAQ